MNGEFVFSHDGMFFQKGLKRDIKGSLGVTASNELVLSDEKGAVNERAPLAQCVFKFSVMLGDSVKINGKKIILSFVPIMKGGGGVVGGMEYAQREDVRLGRQKREEFMALVEKNKT